MGAEEFQAELRPTRFAVFENFRNEVLSVVQKVTLQYFQMATELYIAFMQLKWSPHCALCHQRLRSPLPCPAL